MIILDYPNSCMIIANGAFTWISRFRFKFLLLYLKMGFKTGFAFLICNFDSDPKF